MKRLPQVLILYLVVAFSCSMAQAQFEAPARWVPDDANMIVLVRSSDIFNTDLAKEEKWKREKERAFRAGVSKLPASLDRFLIASQMDFEFMEPVWQVGVFNGKSEMDIVKASKDLGGRLEKLDGNQAVALTNDAYLVKVSSRSVAAMSPANRQMATRWLRKRKNATANLSDYLMSALRFADKNAHIIAALDLEDVVSPEFIKGKLMESDVVDESEVDAFTNVIANIKGLTLGVTIDSKVNGALKVDFKENPQGLGQKGKEILYAALKQNGIFINDLQDWDVTFSENQMMLRGQFSAAGLRQVGMLIEQPLHSEFGSEGSNSTDTKTRSVQYFRSIENLISDLRDIELEGMGTYAKWYEKYARRIDQLSVQYVDPDLIEYGNSVASALRDVSGMLQQAEYGRMSARGSAIGEGVALDRYSYRGYRRGYNSRYSNRSYQRREEGLEKLEGNNQAQEVMRAIDAMTATLRKELSQKYEIDF